MLGDVLRVHRLRRGLTQEDLAAGSGVSVRTIRAIESGRNPSPQQRTVRLLAAALDLTDADRDTLYRARAARPTAVEPWSGLPTPGQLPLGVVRFAGRSHHLRQLDAGVDGNGVVVLTGPPGVGKTTLAVHWARLAAHRFPDGQLYVNLRGFDPEGPVTASAALRGFLEALGTPMHQIPPDAAGQAALFRSLLVDRKPLVVLDNARDAAQVRPLLPGSAGSVVLITSRHSLTGLVASHGATVLPVEPLSRTEALEMLAQRLDAARLSRAPEAAERILDRCAGLPLALAIVSARAASRPTVPLAAITEELLCPSTGLTPFESDDTATDLRAVFSWSYRAVAPAAARLFRLLGMAVGPDVAVPAAASLAALTEPDVRALLRDLCDAHLIAESTPGRYAPHDLLRAYAAELVHATTGDDDRSDALHRLLDHHLHTAVAAAMRIEPTRAAITVPPPIAGITLRLPDSDARATSWFINERPTLLAAVAAAARHGFDRHAWQLTWALAVFLERRGYWDEWASIQRTAVESTARLGDRPAQAIAHRGLAGAYSWLGRGADVVHHLSRALEICQDLGDMLGQARTSLNFSTYHEKDGRYADALDWAKRSRDWYAAAGHRLGEADATNAIGWYHSLLGQPTEALTHCQQALALLTELGDPFGVANTVDSIGHAHHQLGHHDRALGCYQQSLAMFRQLGDRTYEAMVLAHLGDSHAAMGEHASARTAWKEAESLYTELGQPDAEAVRAKLERLAR